MEDKSSKPNPGHRNRNWIGFLLAGIVAAGATVALFAGAQFFYQRTKANQLKTGVLDNPAVAEVSPADTQALRKTSDSFRAVAKAVGPAVVLVKASKGRSRRSSRPGFGEDPRGGGQEQSPFGRGFPFPFPFPMPEQEGPQESMGSGFIIDPKGFVITNNHVIADSDKIVVSLWNETKSAMDKELKAKVIGTDPKTDLAVLKIEGENFPAVSWADATKVEVGDWAIAIGSPFSLTHTVTVGIISAKGRSSRVIGADYAELLQTDAAINPGNSGGPLCTIEGTVMGVNTAIYTRSGGYMGIGFAIPSDVAKQVADTLIKDGKIIRGWLGVYIQPIDEDLAKELKIETGVSIHAVMEDSPAAKGGLEAGDVIVKVDGSKIDDVVQLQKVIAGFKPGQKVRVEVISYKSSQKKNLTITIGELPAEEPEVMADSGEVQSDPDKIGLVVAPVKKGKGVFVQFVEPGSAAEQVGIQQGDVIVRVNRRDIDAVQQYQDEISSSKGRVSIGVNRKGQALFFRFFVPR